MLDFHVSQLFKARQGKDEKIAVDSENPDAGTAGS